MEQNNNNRYVGFTEAVKRNFTQLTNFTGRANKSEFWWNVLVMIIGSIILSPFSSTTVGLVIDTIWSLCFLAVTARRLNDGGHSPWWVYISFVTNIFLDVWIMSSDNYALFTSGQASPTELLAIMALPIFFIPAAICAITSIATFIFCLMGSKE
ncbi:MAG: DUF805 domain-containing protein [Prevotella sp.]|nr:DUF805 domain-containing protein [Prevotella sp.]